ncbi:pre-rRNA processing protein Esf1, putative [Talaromyces stipitatus ATCC 10500]|uniref:Pre-rRNA processing protein Esf1, putative n=1 Tax=Talaromyces stipitatus (strain ATCC 10500 / CBS 375.48 / QM 6759 / NRRL 1006) TaxID=441959 RepID=B8M305_TALSN|nr:pre-rRNA processing protein Esf1, putative [Talaromyces stipitatus ATCC 10500]EED21981.1 pre-rRNA processing protein Esf1, putative [Talaromyces stipitatus ATCC 10500]
MADSSSKKAKRGSQTNADAIITDKRFANIQNDPRYRLPSKRHTHVKLDKRFSHMLRDKDFSRNAAVDRYGRKLKRDDTKKQLEKFYQFEDEDAGNASQVSVDDDEEIMKELEKANQRDYDPARDGGFSESSSSEESSSDEEDEEEADYTAAEVEFPDKQQSDVPLGEVTNRIAVVNLDWDNIRAEDLMAVFSSFTTGGRIKRVTIYPSEFGKERMEREELEGPPKEIFASKSESEDDEDYEEPEDSEEEEEAIKKSILKEDEGAEFNTTQLRQYQLERLRYFYAIIEFSSKETAKQVYDAVDGTEYLSSANFFDLRFVPDDTDFSDDKPREQCDRIPDGYKPTDFVTDALQHSRVKLTWDADDKARKDAQAKAFKGGRKEIEENDLKAYLASDTSDDEGEEQVEVVDATTASKSSSISKKEAERQRMRTLLGLGDEPAAPSKSKGPVGDMEITFTSGLAGEPARESVFENEPEIEETTVEKYIRKQRERKKQRKEKLKKKAEATGDAKAEGAENKAAEEDLGFNDPFFDEPESKAKNSQRKEERRRKREEKAAEEAAAAAKRAELELLMVDDQSAGMSHFDMNEIEKAEKKARKKGKKGKSKQEQEHVAGDDFQVDVADPRFASLYESHEFAIDPTNPKFKPTSGMKALLEEGRKRRRVRGADDDVPTETTKKQKKASKSGDAADDIDLKKLVARVKSKTKKT